MPQRLDHYACPKCERVTYWRKEKGKDNYSCVECGFFATKQFLERNEVIPTQPSPYDEMDIGKVVEEEFDAIEENIEDYVEGVVPAQGTIEAGKEIGGFQHPKDVMMEEPFEQDMTKEEVYLDQAEVERKIKKVNALEVEKEKDEIGWNLFTAAMKRRLATKRMEGKHGWWDEEALTGGMLLDKLRDALVNASGDIVSKELESALVELVDLGNYAMMLYNRLKGSVKE